MLILLCVSVFFCLFANLDVIIVRSQQFENSIYTPREWEAGFDEKKLLREVIDHPRLHFATLSHANYVCVFASLFSSSLSVCLVTCKRETWIIYSCCRVLVNLSSHIYTSESCGDNSAPMHSERHLTVFNFPTCHGKRGKYSDEKRDNKEDEEIRLNFMHCTAAPRWSATM